MSATYRTTEVELNHLGFSVVGKEAVPLNEARPDATWSHDRLVAYAEAQLQASHDAEKQSLLESHKSAVALFWAGAALFYLRTACKCKGRGVWTTLKSEQGWADTTANDAIRLYESAKTPETLTGLGITEAKQRFVYPSKDGDQDDDVSGDAPSLKRNASTAAQRSAQAQGKQRRISTPPPPADIDPLDTTVKTYERLELVAVAVEGGRVDDDQKPRLRRELDRIKTMVTRIEGLL